MDLSDVVLRGTYRYDRTAVIAVALLPGEASEDDPTGPRDADMVMIRYRDDDHKFIVDPADLAPLDPYD